MRTTATLSTVCNHSLWTLRPPRTYSAGSLESSALGLVSKVRYKTKAKDAEAPYFCNCVTAIRYLFAQTTKVFIPHAWIGNLPRGLLSLGWSCLKVEYADLRAGDVIFLKKRKSRREITHMAVALSANRFFHCTSKKETRGCEVVECKSLHKRYKMVSGNLMTYQDHRTSATSFGKAILSIPRMPKTLLLERWKLLRFVSLTRDEYRSALMVVVFSLDFFNRVPEELLSLQLSSK